MRDHPLADDLVRTAIKVFREELMPELPASHRTRALMVARALDIALRQIETGDASEQAEWQSVSALGEGLAPSADAFDRDALERANRKLSQLIRNGEADPGTERGRAVYFHLRATAQARLNESNPRLLAPGGAGDGTGTRR